MFCFSDSCGTCLAPPNIPRDLVGVIHAIYELPATRCTGHSVSYRPKFFSYKCRDPRIAYSIICDDNLIINASIIPKQMNVILGIGPNEFFDRFE